MSTPRTIRSTFALAFAALLVGLLGGTAAAATGPGAASAGTAWVRVGHFVPGLGSTRIDLTPTAGGAPSVTMTGGAVYGDVTKYRRVAPGTYTATVRDSASGSAAMLSRSVQVTAGQARTLAVLGSAEQPRLALLTDDLTPPAAGTSRVRVLSASASAGAVSVAAKGGPTVASDAVLGQATPYASVPAGTWTLDLTGAAAASTQSVDLAAGSVYTVVVLDAGRAVRLELLTDAAGASAMPVGGARTGEGGTAVSTSWLAVVARHLGGDA